MSGSDRQGRHRDEKWLQAFVKPIRKLHSNLIITFVSVVTAMIVGGVETLGLLGRQGSATTVWRASTPGAAAYTIPPTL
jgi:high-affinity nickel permease